MTWTSIANGQAANANIVREFMSQVSTQQISDALTSNSTPPNYMLSFTTATFYSGLNFTSGPIMATAFADATVNATHDAFNDSSVDPTKWITGGEIAAFTENASFLFFKDRVNNNVGSSYIQSSGNVFNTVGGYVFLSMGSMIAAEMAAGDTFTTTVRVGGSAGTTVFEQLFNGADGAISGAELQLMSVGSDSFYFRSKKASDTSYSQWSGTSATAGFSIGNGKLQIEARIDADGGAGNFVTGSLIVNSVKFMSGTFSVEARFSGATMPLRFQDNGVATDAIFWMNGQGTVRSGLSSTASLNGGLNFTSIPIGSWTTFGVGGSRLEMRYIQSGTYYSGLFGGLVIQNGAFIFN